MLLSQVESSELDPLRINTIDRNRCRRRPGARRHRGVNLEAAVSHELAASLEALASRPRRFRQCRVPGFASDRRTPPRACPCRPRRARANDQACWEAGPRDVARHRAAQYRAIGFSHQKVRALLALARAPSTPARSTSTRSPRTTTPGFATGCFSCGASAAGPDYVLLRGLGRLNVFPGDDDAAQKSLAGVLGQRRSTVAA